MTSEQKGAAPASEHRSALNFSELFQGMYNGILDRFVPSGTVTVRYPDGTAINGEEIHRSQAQAQPEVDWGWNAGDLYTLLFFDPDVPSEENPYMRSFVHWLVVNIPGNRVQDGREMVNYLGPAPPAGKHRYIFLVLRQKRGRISMCGPASRTHFDVSLFVRDHYLEPHAANFFLCGPAGVKDKAASMVAFAQELTVGTNKDKGQCTK